MTSEYIEFTAEEITEQMKNNLGFMYMAPITYFVKNKLALDEYVKYIGEIAAKGWEQAKGWSIKDVARQFALNYATLGATKVAINVGETEATVKLDEWLSEDDLQYYGISQNDCDRVLAIGEPIAEFLDLQFSWKREKDSLIMTLKK